MNLRIGGGVTLTVAPPGLGRRVTVAPPQPSIGVVVVPVPGPPGPPGAAGSGVLHRQLAPAAAWTIPHLFDRPPSVQVVVDGEVVLADVIHLPGVVVVQFPEPTAGLAVLT